MINKLREEAMNFDEYVKRSLTNRLNWGIVVRLLYGARKVGCTAREYQVYLNLKPWVDIAATLAILGMIYMVASNVWSQL